MWYSTIYRSCPYHLLPIIEFAYNNTPNVTIGLTLFYTNKGYHPSITIHPEHDIAFTRAQSTLTNFTNNSHIANAQKHCSAPAKNENEVINNQIFTLFLYPQAFMEPLITFWLWALFRPTGSWVLWEVATWTSCDLPDFYLSGHLWPCPMCIPLLPGDWTRNVDWGWTFQASALSPPIDCLACVFLTFSGNQ